MTVARKGAEELFFSTSVGHERKLIARVGPTELGTKSKTGKG